MLVRTLFRSLIAGSFVLLSLWLWRAAYQTTDWAVVLLLPLTVCLFRATYLNRLSIYRAIKPVVLRETSLLGLLAPGRVRAGLAATVFALTALPILAWLSLTSGPCETAVLAPMTFLSAFVFGAMKAKLDRHLTTAFSRDTSLLIASLVAVPFIPVAAWINYNCVAIPGQILNATLQETMQIGVENLPARRGWVAQIISPFFAFEYAKLWLVTRNGAPAPWAIWFSVDAALVCLIMARTSGLLMLTLDVMLPSVFVKEPQNAK